MSEIFVSRFASMTIDEALAADPPGARFVESARQMFAKYGRTANEISILILADEYENDPACRHRCYERRVFSPSEERLFHYLDEGRPPNAGGWTPSAMFVIGESFLRTTSNGGAKIADQYRAWVIATARQRYREGYYADPFTNKPRRRQESAA